MRHQREVYFAIYLFCFILIQESHGKWSPDCEEAGMIFGETCYVTYTDELSYSDAVSRCSTIGGQIAIMKSSLIQAIIAQDFSEKRRERREWTTWFSNSGEAIGYLYNFRPGINDISSEGSFQYADGTSLNSFCPWAPKEPNNGAYWGVSLDNTEEDCVTVSSKEIWYDANCGNQHHFACEFKRDHQPCNIQEVVIPNAEYKSCYTQDKITFEDSLLIKCHEGYVLVGPNNVKCLSDSRWSPTPQCVQGCSPPEELANAKFLNQKAIYTLGSNVTYVCNDGYVTEKQRKTHSHITCGPNDKWLPEDSGCSLDEKYTIGIMEVESRSTISIPCVTNDNDESVLDDFINAITPYLWLKNSEDINKTGLDYSIDINGTLTINNMSQDAVGQYICFQDNQQLTPGLLGFELKVAPAVCPPSHNTTIRVTLREGSSFVLNCPHTSSDHDFTWFKDGQRYYARSNQTLFPDGSLHTKTVKYYDQGLYTCRMLVKNTLCERNHSTHVVVIASSSSICGRAESEFPHPWAVSLWLKDEIAPFCYGVLINESWVVTSANCLTGFNRKRRVNVFVRFSYREKNLHIEEDDKDVEVKTVKIHPKFSKKLHVNDVGLVQLKRPVTFSRSIRPICLTDMDFTIKKSCERSPPVTGTVVGWGPLEKDDYEEHPTMLSETKSIVSSRDDCFSTDHSYFENILCLKQTERTKTTLAGDAGSPLEVFWKDRVYLFGIYSWGERASLVGQHDYFTKINDYIPWLTTFSEGSDPEAF